jgi:tetratricopeptide (TPR) repeat protein
MMKRMPAGELLIVAVLAVCSAWMPSPSMAEPIGGTNAAAAPAAAAPGPDLTEAGKRFSSGDFEGAANLLREAVKQNPDLPPAQVMMARMFMQSNLAAEGRRRLERAIVEEPADPTAYMLMGDLALREGRIAEAELDFQKVQSLLPKFEKSAKQKSEIESSLCSGLASVAEARQNWAEAKKQWEALLKLEPTNTMALQRLAHCLVQQKDPASALEMLQKAAALDPQTLTPEALLARLCEQAHDRENAKKYMAMALLVAPKNIKTRLVAARWAFDTEDLENALAQTNIALKIDEKSLDAKILRGMIAAYKKDYRTAERYSEEAHLQAPDNFVASNNLALALVEQRDETKKRRALQYAEENLKKYPKSVDALSTYGWVLYKMGRLDEAENVLRTAIQGASFNPDMAYYLACVDLDRNQEIEARALLTSALREPGLFAMRQEAQERLNQLNKTQLNKTGPIKDQPVIEPPATGTSVKGLFSKEPAAKQPPATEPPAKK